VDGGRFLPIVRYFWAVVLSLCPSLAGCVSAPHDQPPRLVVFAAASMIDVLTSLEQEFEAAAGAMVTTSYGATSDLARQIQDGAPADVFVAASRAWVDHLQQAGRVKDGPRVLARNRLVCIVPRGSLLASGGVDDPGSLVDAGSKEEIKFGIGYDGVPAGDFTREALRNAGVWDELAPMMVGQKDVRAVLRAVAAGALDAGFVYATDVVAQPVTALFEVDPGLHGPIEVLAVIPVTATSDELALRYLDFLSSASALRALSERGFAVP
jgi:molybdate transport system substrate-binding protein